MTHRAAIFMMGVLLTNALPVFSGAWADSGQTIAAIPAEDYVLYDQVMTRMFLTSATRLVVIERMTRLRLSPDQEGPTTASQLLDPGFFNGELPLDLTGEFIVLNRQSSRLEGKFHFGVGYRFATGEMIEEPEVSLGQPVTGHFVRPVQVSAILGRLAFSRVARTLRNDQALVYVDVLRPDDTGAGFLIWFHRLGQAWTIMDTEVVWTIQPREEGDYDSLLAP
ncbi:MAG: hypothetical protein OEV08_07035 [Nitrospira sp.]|nr:hypothetical protein [Nitrospira sp.]